jgi:hypothetical protein
MTAVIVVLPCADTGQADQVATAIRDAGTLEYTALEGGEPVVLQVSDVAVVP